MKSTRIPGILLAVACLSHAASATALWYALFFHDWRPNTSADWLFLAVSWPLWALLLLPPGKQQRLQWLAVLVISLVVLSPTFSTLYTFAIWSIEGFAP